MSNALFMVFLTTCDLITAINLFKEYKPGHLVSKSYVAEAYPSIGPFNHSGAQAVTASDDYRNGRSASFHVLGKCL